MRKLWSIAIITSLGLSLAIAPTAQVRAETAKPSAPTITSRSSSTPKKGNVNVTVTISMPTSVGGSKITGSKVTAGGKSCTIAKTKTSCTIKSIKNDKNLIVVAVSKNINGLSSASKKVAYVAGSDSYTRANVVASSPVASSPVATATTISVAAIAGVTAPVAGATPVTTTTAGTGYTGTVAWSGSPTAFNFATTYTAIITLTPTSGYTLTGVSADFFTVAGATSDTNSADSGVITAVFPATDSSYAVGDRGPGGGIVFYVSAASFASPGSTCNTAGAGGISACKYLEVAPATWQDTTAPYTDVTSDATYMWSALGRATTQDITTASTEGIVANSASEKLNWKIGQGFYNTSLMNTSTTSAAKDAVLAYAGSSTAGQWFIPSMNELNELCKYAKGQTTGNLTVVCASSATLKTGTTSDLEGFVASVSYASSSEASTTNAYFRNFSNGTHSSISKSSIARQIRPIRAF